MKKAILTVLICLIGFTICSVLYSNKICEIVNIEDFDNYSTIYVEYDGGVYAASYSPLMAKYFSKKKYCNVIFYDFNKSIYDYEIFAMY